MSGTFRRQAWQLMRRLAVVLALIVWACGGNGSVRGIIVEFEGDLTQVESFSVLTTDRDVVEFVPAPGLSFHGGPLSHLRQHMISGETVTVSFVEEDGRLVAVEVGDG